jgi:Restriction endonuclease EcoRV
MSKFAEQLIKKMESLKDSYEVCGVIDKKGRVYSLGADTKVLSTIFELISRPVVYSVAKDLGLEVVEPSAQNHYPDFTLHLDQSDKKKIAVDVKTTYRDKSTDAFGYTLGGYTSFIRAGKEHKNIVYPFDHYKEHWVIGFVYDRVPAKAAAADHIFEVNQVKDIPLPFKNVEVFVQEKWRIASGSAGSGNTTNIGSIRAMIDDFRAGKGPFKSEDEFLDYWRGYGTTAANRKDAYSTVPEYRALLKKR